ncbi:polysaccharide pyruvyl transferase [Prosthecobacter fusiformis]|uniref:Polysaccharide pyruvyl transferase n=1 Tax=Prosthecobacter fusiformis TaxID=48464 RepID=A0A4R7RI52_9BACT|nr:polysaccharide pyruvyl transferase family protein [Prosthecobacter fusiformis]TDU62465.1 polysaccharide pyruvyl transferase [Prosthecobacter fusiformis]
MNRRHFLTTSLAAVLAPIAAQEGRVPRIILRSSWQTVNIGDIAHTPGVLALLEKHLPHVEVRLWPSKVDNGVDEMLMKRFPKLIILKKEDLKQAFEECDFLLHGSGPSLVAQNDVVKWSKATGKPYGVYGITVSAQSSTVSNAGAPTTIEVLNGAKFAFFRDSVSLEGVKANGCTCPIMEFGPDGAFATDLRDDEKALAFLKEHNLEEGKFLCCIGRMRNTPYWKMKPGHKFDEAKHKRNEAMKEHDLAPLRQAIIEVVKQTDMKVLLCPEDSSQMEINKENFYDKLPEDVKAKVVWKSTYWLTGEALSTYVRSAGLFGAEMHSPIMCIGNGIPAIVCRWTEQTSKGLMWRDIGLGEWLFNMDEESEIPGIVPAVVAMAKDPAAAKAKALKGQAVVHERQRLTMEIVGKSAQAAVG